MPDRTDVVFLQGARTPMAEYVTGRRGDGQPGGLFKDLSALDLGAIAAREAIRRSGVPAERIDHVVMGNALQTSADALYGARHVGLKAGVPVAVPALTVNRLCGSGIQAFVSAAQMIRLGEASVVLTGGMENMSQAPMVIRGAREGFRLGQGKLEDLLFASLLDTYCGLMMAQTAERLAERHGITREAQDAYGLRSQQAAAAGKYLKSARLYQTAILPQARLTVESALAAYRVNRADILMLLDSQMTVFNYETSLVAAMANHNKALAEIDLLTGRSPQ